MNQYLYTTSPVRVNTFHNPTGEEADYLEQHDQYIQKLTKDGTVIFSGALRLVERRPFALTIFQAEDDAAANTIVNNDPAVKDRILIGRLFPYRVALWNYESTQLANDQKHFLYKIQVVRPDMLHDGGTELEQTAIRDHFMYLKEQTEAGVFSVVGRTLNTDHSTFGIGVLRAKDEDEAWKIGSDDPAIIRRVQALDILPFTIEAVNPAFRLES